MKPDFRQDALVLDKVVKTNAILRQGSLIDPIVEALRAAYAAGLERAAEIAIGITPPTSIGRDHGRHHAAGAQAAARAIRAEKEAEDATPGPWKCVEDERSFINLNCRPTGRTYIAGWDIEASEKMVVDCEGIGTDGGNDAAYIAAASPDVVLGLLDEIERLKGECDFFSARSKEERANRGLAEKDFHDAMELVRKYSAERDQLRAVAVRLKGYLENIQGNTRQDVVRWDCETALADPEVEKL